MTKLHRVLKRHGIPTTRLIDATKTVDPEREGYSRTYVYGLRRGTVANPTHHCMTVVLKAVRVLSGDRALQITDLFDVDTIPVRRKAS